MSAYPQLHWDNATTLYESGHAVVIDGHCYAVGAHGFEGAKFSITLVSGVSLETSLGHLGEVPEHLRTELPDNAIFDEGYQWRDFGTEAQPCRYLVRSPT